MRLRIAQEPWGVARFAYSFLGVVVMTLSAAILTVIINPIVNSMNVCGADAGYCHMSVTALIAVICFFAVGFPVAYVFRLGWLWAAWLLVLTLVVVQVSVEANLLRILVTLLFVPILAAAIVYERPDRETSKGWRIARILLLVVCAAQFAVWLVLVAGMPGALT